jgi:hypothetical protein
MDLSSLVIRLSADTVTLQGDFGRAGVLAEQFGAKVQREVDAAAKAIGAGVAAAAAGMATLVGRALENADNLSKLSQKVGVSTEALSALQYQAGLAGVGIDALQVGIVKFSKTIGMAIAGGKEQVAVFAAMGVSLKDTHGQLKPTDQLLGEVADKFKTYKAGASSATLAQLLFGKAGADMIPLLRDGSEGMAAAAKEAAAYGRIVGGDAAKAAETFNDNVDKIKGAVEGFANQVMQRMAPGLAEVSTKLAEGAKQGDTFSSMADGMADSLTGLMKAAFVTKGAIEGLVNLIAASIDTLGGFKTMAQGAAENIMHSAAGIGDLLTGQFAKAKLQFQNANDALVGGAQAGAKQINGAWSAAADGIDAAIKRADALAAALDKPKQAVGQFANVIAGVGPEIKLVEPLLPKFGETAKKTANDAAAFIEQLEKQVATFGKSAIESKRYEAAHKDLSDQQRELASALIDTLAEWDKYAKVVKAAFDASDKLVSGNADLEEQLAQGRDKLAGLSNAQVTYNAAVRDANKLAKDALALGPPTMAVQKAMEDHLKNLGELRDQGDAQTQTANIESMLSKFGDKNPVLDMIDQVKTLREEIEKLPGGMEKYGDALDAANKQIGVKMVGSFAALLGAARSFTEEGSKSYQAITKGMAALQIVQDVIALRAAVIAVLTQAEGEPYTAFARMAAMAAAVAPFLASIGQSLSALGGGGGPSAQSAEVRQAHQGTGTILGDADAKSESIAKATEITANATQQLVGLNRGMLNALQSMQAALGAAGNQIARGAADADFGAGPGVGLAPGAIIQVAYGIDGGSGDWAGLFHSDPKLIDQGVKLLGGALGDMLDGIVAVAYQEFQTGHGLLGGLFEDDQYDELTASVSEKLNHRFQLILGSLAETVEQAAVALGLPLEDIQRKIAEFQIAEQTISLKDLSSEDQQKAIEAVFSSIFDGLAASVVPFIEQFQKVGEGLGETLVRVATEVQVAQEAFKQLGIAVSVTDPEKFAQIADGLVEASGGLDSFIQGMQSFVQNFSSDANKFAVDADALNSAFEQVGLTLPATRDGMWDLMQSLDATTEAGRAQIATLLRLSDTANSYYDQLAEFTSNLGLSGQSEFNKELMSIRDSAIGLIKALQSAGASTQTLQRVYDASVSKINALVEQLKASAQSLAFSLGLTTQGSLEQINSEIARLQGLAGNGASAVHGFGAAMQDASQRASDAINLLIGDLSPLNDRAKLEEARKGLMAGQVTQDQFLEIARRLYASSQQYKTEFAFAQQFPGAGNTPSVGAGNGGSQGLTGAQQQRLADLLEEQKKLTAQNQLQQYRDFAQQVAQISSATGENFEQVLGELGVTDIDELVKGLGLQNKDQLKAYIENLQAQQESDGDNTKSIVDVLKQILVALGGTPDSNAGGAPPVPTVGREPGAGEGRGRNISDDDADAIGEAVYRAVTRPGPNEGFRNSRMPAFAQ